MQKERIPVYVGCSSNPSMEEINRACAASMVLFNKGFLPIMPFIHERLFVPQGDDLMSLRLQLMRSSGVRDAIFVGQPTDQEAALAVALGLNCRYSFQGRSTLAITVEQHRKILKLSHDNTSLADIMAATGLGETAVLKYKKIPIVGGAETLTPVQEHRLRRENSGLKEKLERALETQILNQSYQDFISNVADRRVTVPDWVKVVKGGRRTATPTANLSDTHFGEVIDSKQINYVNGFNREIGKRRLGKFFNGVARLAHEYLQGFDYPGLVLTLGGDMFSGNIHEELQRTNEGTLCEEILYWLEPMLSGIRFMADEFGKVMIPCVVGNHPRNTRKPAMKDRVRDNFDWLFYCLLKKFLMDDARITFLVSEAADIHYPIYNTKFCLTHGDQFRGGSGIAGFLSPLMIGDARKQKRASAMKMPYDYMVMGHWHQLAFFRRLIVNGSLKGYDEYASINNFDFEPPRQAFYLTDPQRGVTIQAPIHLQCEKEGWERNNQDLLVV